MTHDIEDFVHDALNLKSIILVTVLAIYKLFLFKVLQALTQ